MILTLLIVVTAVLAWWASTGVVLYLAHLPPSTFRWTLAGAAVLTLVGLVGLAATRDDTTLTGAFVSFLCGLAVWAWQEVSFYTGALTGTRKEVCAPSCSGLRHFGHALMASLHHELSILISLIVMVGISWGAANQVGLWTFVVLLVMHESARLNVMLGVRNVSAQFVPKHLEFLKGFLNRQPMNMLFPVSVTASTIAATLLVQVAAGAATPFEAAHYTFLSAILVLGIIEHWVLILPMPLDRLWEWSLAAKPDDTTAAGRHGDGTSPRSARADGGMWRTPVLTHEGIGHPIHSRCDCAGGPASTRA